VRTSQDTVGLLDVHAHFLPPWYVDVAREHGVFGSDSCFPPPPAIDLQLALLDQTWAELGGDVPWRAQTRANAERLVARPHWP
jgi:hypothetical protein